MPRSTVLARLLLAPALLLSAIPAAHAQAAAQGEVLHASLAAADSLMAAAYPATGPGATVIVARDGQVLMRKAYGLASLELGVPMRTDHVLRIGSITKQFTAVATLMLMDEGKLSLSDDITRFFPDYPTQGRRITVEHLLTHTSGIRSYTSLPQFGLAMRNDMTTAQLIAMFRDVPMDFAPGEDWRYNNSGYVLLGAIIEKVSGQSYGEFLRTRVFEPLGMSDTRYETQAVITPRRVPGYTTATGRESRNAAYLSMSLPYAAGSLVSTVDDLLRWGRAVAEGRLLKRETWTRAFTAFPMTDGRGSGYGYGWFVGQVAGRPSVEHGGDINGFSSNGLWIPSERLHVYVLSNAERDYANPGDLSNRIAEQALGGRPEIATVALAADKLDEYVGVYQLRDGETRTITRDGERVTSRRGQGTPQEIRPLGGDEFLYPTTGTRATFLRGADGRVTGMRTRPRVGPEEPVAPRTSDAPAPPLTLAPEVLDRYVGEYEVAPNFVITVRREGTTLIGHPTNQNPTTMVALTETRFRVVEVEATVEFQRDASGTVTGLVLWRGGQTMPARKIK